MRSPGDPVPGLGLGIIPVQQLTSYDVCYDPDFKTNVNNEFKEEWVELYSSTNPTGKEAMNEIFYDVAIKSIQNNLYLNGGYFIYWHNADGVNKYQSISLHQAKEDYEDGSKSRATARSGADPKILFGDN